MKDSFEKFVDQASNSCYDHLKTEYLKKEILKDTEKLTRFAVGEDMLEKICQATLEWQQQNFENIIHTVVLQELKLEFKFSEDTLDFMQNKLQKLKIDFDTNGVFLNALFQALKFIAAGFVLSVSATLFFVNPLIPMGVFGLYAATGLSTFGTTVLLKDFKDFRNGEYDKILKRIGKNEIAVKFRSWYAKPFETILKIFFDKEFNDSLGQLEKMREFNNLLAKKVNKLTDLKCKITEYDNRLNECV